MSSPRKIFPRAVWVVLCLLIFCPNGVCQKTKKIQVFVKHEGEDSVGTQLAFAVRESLRRSEGYASADDEASTVIEMVTIQTQPGVSAVSVVMVKKGSSPLCSFNLAHYVYSIGSLRIKDMADDIVANLDRQVNEFGFLYKE